jgi:hypothetical protein
MIYPHYGSDVETSLARGGTTSAMGWWVPGSTPAMDTNALTWTRFGTP